MLERSAAAPLEWDLRSTFFISDHYAMSGVVSV